MPKYSFRSKIFVAFLFLVLAFMVLTVLIYGQRIESQLQKETVERAKRNIDLVALLLEERRAAQETDGLDPWISRIGARLGVRITYMEDGRVLADSNVPSAEVPDMEDHSTRPEVVQALEQAVGIAKRHSATLNRDLIYAARQVPGGVLRVAVPMADVEARRAGMVSALLWSMPFAVLAALGIGFVLSRSLTRSISQFSEAARAIGEGRYGDRLRVYPGSEFKTLADAVNRMASDIQSHIKELQDEQGQRAALFDSLSEGVLVVDSSGAIRDWNPAFARMVSGETLLKGKSLLEVMLEPRLQRLVDEVIKNPEYDGRRMLSFRYGERELELMVEPFHDVAQERKIVVVMRDMTELRRLEAIRSDFVANVSHEMRTPLTNIRGYAETLQDMEGLPESCDRFISVIIKNVGQMTRIVSDLLQLTRLEHESGAIESSSVHAPTALNDAFSSLEYAAREKGVRIERDIAPDAEYVMSDRQGLETVFRNLLDNAVRHSPEGEVVIVRGVREGDVCVYEVRDFGAGVPKGLEGRIFERFYRAPEVRNAHRGGSGLGLALCHHTLRAHGGSIEVVAPEDGAGAVFRFTLRAADSAEEGETSLS
ncbi:sensor histidine kinase [Oceanidesulfovibrio indonesiensis]|uniref:histidine kinase n=2 Tax=Oceanidesulfovibrio indonesiensis TaxID=54767 RepID=A0A7M3MAS6_9BACT|nr:sensor histidine kinase [Oceanidesulfovibrio indonesiensis]